MDNQEVTYVEGVVEKIIFTNQQEQFFIVSVKVTEASFDFKEPSITVTGTLPGLAEGMGYKFCGKLVHHPKYGEQFKADTFSVNNNSDDPDTVVKFFVSRGLPGIGEKTAKKIVDKLGTDAVDKIINDPESLDGLKINSDNQKIIREQLVEDHELNQVLLAFNKFQISQSAAIQAYDLFGVDAVNILRENPYYFLGRIKRLNFNQIDQACYNYKLEITPAERITGALKWVIKEMINRSGSTLIDRERVIKNTDWVISKSPEGATDEDYIESCLVNNDEDFFYFLDNYVTTSDYARYELEIVNVVNALNHKLNNSTKKIEQEIIDFEEESKLKLDKIQEKAVKNAFTNNFSIITGGPGTGKTTIVKAIIKIFAKIHDLNLKEQEQEQDSGILLTAPTGKAAKSLSEKSHFPASTIHRLVKIHDIEDRNSETELISPDLLIIDELSLVDTGLFAQLLRSLKTKPTIVVLGDVDQLPSVGAGQVFKDLIDSDVIPVTVLQKNFRQEAGGNIINFANLVNSGEIYESMDDDYDDLKIISATGTDVITNIESIVKNELNNEVPITEIQILAPMYRGVGGINDLNEKIRDLVNPNKNRINGFAVGDKVIQLENNPDKNIYNGEIGIVNTIERLHGRLATKVMFSDEQEIIYEPDELNQLALAYAISIHKAQGSEFKTVIITMQGKFDNLLRRNLLYTAVTRAADRLYLVGDLNTFIRAASLPPQIRITGLVKLLQDGEDKLVEIKAPQIANEEKKPEKVEKYILTPDNYESIDPMVGMVGITPYDQK